MKPGCEACLVRLIRLVGELDVDYPEDFVPRVLRVMEQVGLPRALFPFAVLRAAGPVIGGAASYLAEKALEAEGHEGPYSWPGGGRYYG
ncbi:MAG: hypothetical protein ACTSSA_11820 [Candidatus Freyarchaeota archaeon]